MTDKENAFIDGEILIVEDTPEALELLTEIMQTEGYTVRQAQDGEMALMSVRNRLPDLILLDVRMPGIDGFEVCRRLKLEPETAGVPIIFLSAMHDTEARIEGLKLGAMDYIGKPYEAEEVLLRVRTHLELYNLQQRLGEMCEIRTQQLYDEVQERRQAEDELFKSRQDLRKLTAHLQEVREVERARIAREIHDELGQSLTVMRIDLAHLLSNLDLPKAELEEQLRAVIGIVDQAADTARSISENLRPGMLDLLGLGAAIENHVQRFSETTGLAYTLQLDGLDDINVDSKVATAAFRIVQEALTNVARHAQAQHVTIRIADFHQDLHIIVEDDGIGISQQHADPARGHYGLLGMHERAQSLGGRLSLESVSPKGTRIEAVLPQVPQEAL